ncbi:DNA ligase D [Zunongwangia sp. HGR-M22]|uniref:DNA ligase D n=1 Tax=Zunongwangia sp. HGR-M22 TaxID=3015168 RepID=UPI0022DD0714|nr:DNA ligase D [Zunongwangia sp. HGR-M22]WBL25035.1 DNA ligase D [Zunongwangia sp. HGR-M22]
MSLDEYKKKRNFENTPEPEDGETSDNLNRFVIQRHQATRLHYDLRLEIGGTLKSWAVPKGPSMNPMDKRLAVHTEDHPIKYLKFQGEIPKGNYGAGQMDIWDAGTFSSKLDSKSVLEQYEDGDLKITLSGGKLKGDFALVHTKQGKENHWLLIKKKDQFSTDLIYDAEVYAEKTSEEKASKAKPKVRTLKPEDTVKPMLATTAKEIFNHPDWIYELKWDGYRLIAHVDDGDVRIYSRNGINYGSKFPLLVKDLKQLDHQVILDGEVVIVDKNGIPNFQALQNYDQNTPGTLRFYVFDMLFLNGHSMLELPLKDRKSLIPEILEDLDYTFYCDHIEGMGTAFYKKAVDNGTEGVIAKKADSTYAPGYRTESWLKIKAVESEEAIICGYTNSKGAVFGSLILGMYQDGKLKYVGNCGSGFSNAQQKELLQKMDKLASKESPFISKINLKGRTPNWIKPQLICEVKFSEWTKAGSMRHPVFKGLREDKSTIEIKPEEKTEAPEPEKVNGTSGNLDIGGISVPFTNLNKIYWPKDNITKYDLIEYYLQVSEVMLPYLKNRPQNLHRHPNGIQQKGFYQKDNESLPDWIKTTNIYSDSSEKNIEYMLCQNEATLLYMANLGCIEINPWHSKVGNLDTPNYGVIDLDPSAKNTFEDVIETAKVVKEVLDSAKIDGYCKTSGSKGVHIYVPFGKNYSYEEGRDFIKLICYLVQERLPELTSMERAVKARKDKIYLDYLQNRRGQTIAAPYSVRPKAGATVSTPVSWDELKSGLKISDFTIFNVPERISEVGDLFEGILKSSIDMEKALANLSE